MVDGLETELGGFARMNTLIEAQRAQNPDTLVIDGGDFSMGTLIQTVFETQAAELRMLGYRGRPVQRPDAERRDRHVLWHIRHRAEVCGRHPHHRL